MPPPTPPLAMTATEASIVLTLIVVGGFVVGAVLWQVFSVAQGQAERDLYQEAHR